MTGETDTEIPDTGAVFTFGKSYIANNVPSRLWLKNDTPVHISCGQAHSAFVTEQGRLFVFGSNNSGQLGLQTKGPVTKPTCVKVLKGERVQFVACGTDHTLVSTLQGDIFVAGGNSDGQLGLGHCNASVSFQRLRPFCDYAPIKLLSAGGHTSAVLTEDGRLFLWGDNSVGQLGLGNDSHALLPKELKLGRPIQWVSCGHRHSALVTDNGDVFTFGESADGRLGLSAHQLVNHNFPQQVESLHGVLQVACGGKHTLALTEDELYSFGRGEFGQLGLGTLMFVADAPVAVGHFRKGRVTHVTCGENHSALITDSGLLYTFGDGRHGKLGHGDENFTNQFSPTVCQRFFEYTVMAVTCGSSHMLVFARPRQQETEEVCLEDEDVAYSYLDRCYTSMLQGQTLEHIPDPTPARVSQLVFLPSSLPTSHRWSLSTRARRRQRESSSAQFGPEFCSLPPLTTGFTALALTGKLLQPRSPTDTPKRFRTDVPVESPSTSVSLSARTPPFRPITKSVEDCHRVGSSENSMSDKTREQHKHKMARSSSVGNEENVPQQSSPTEGSVSHPSMTEYPPPSNLKHKKPRAGDPKNPATKMQSKIYKKTTQSTNNKCKGQAEEVRSSPERMSDKEMEGCSEAPSANNGSRHKVSKVDKYADLKCQEVTTLAEKEQGTKSSSLKIQNTCSPVQKGKQVTTIPTNGKEVKSPKIIQEGIPVRATKSAKSPVKVQDMSSGKIEVSVVESTLQTDPAQKDLKPFLGKAQEVRSTLIDTQEQGNTASVKSPAKMQITAKKGNEKNTVDTEENPGEFTAKKRKKKRSDVEKAPVKETAPKTPNSLSVSIPTRMSKAKKRKPVEAEKPNNQLRTEMLVKRENDSKTPQDSNISFPPIENRKSGGTAEISQSASNFQQSEHKNSHSPTDKVLTEQKCEFPSIKSLQPERGHSFSSSWSNNESAISKSATTKESSSGNLLSQSPQHRQSPLKEMKLDGKSVESEEPNRKPQAEKSIMGSVVSSLPAMAIACAAPLLIKAAEVLSETSPEQSNKMSLCESVSQGIAGNDILPEQEVDQDSTVQDVSSIEEIDFNSTRKQNSQDVQSKLVSDENRKMEDKEEEDVKDSETEKEEMRGEEESLPKEEDGNEKVGQKEENSAVEDEEERESDNDEDSDSAQKGEEGEEEESEKDGQKEENSAVEDVKERESDNDEDSVQNGEEDVEEEEGEEEESEWVGQKEENSAVEDEEERESDNDEDSVQKGKEDVEEEEGEEEESEGVGQKEENSAVEDEEERESDDDEDSVQKGEEDVEEEEGEEEESEGVGQKEENSAVEDEEERESDDDEDSVQKGEEDVEEEEGEEEESEGVGKKEENSAVEDEEERESDDDEDSVQKGEEDVEEEEGEEEESEAAGEEEDDSNSGQSSKSDGEKSEEGGSGDETERAEEESEGEDGEIEEEENKDEESGGEDEEEEKGSWDEGSEGEVEDEEREEEQQGESSNEEKTEVQSDSEDENKNVRSEEEEGESEENDGSEEEEEGEGEQEEKGDKESEEEDEVGNEDEEEDEEEETDHEDEEGNRDQAKEEEEEENDEEEEVEEDKEEEVDEEETNEELKDKKDGVTNSEEEEGEESVKEKEERQNEVEAEDKENISETNEDSERQEGSGHIEEENGEKEGDDKEGKMDGSEVKFEEENLDISETRKVNRGDEDNAMDKLNEIMEENNEEESGSEDKAEEEERDKKKENKKTDRSERKQTETNEEEEEDSEAEEEETEQEEKIIKPEINRRKKKEFSEEEEEEEPEEESEEEEEEAELKEISIKTEKNRRKQRETSEEEEEQEEESEEEEEEEEAERKEINIKTEINRMKRRETSEEEEEQEEESEEEEEEEEAERKEINIKTEKNRMKRRETREEEEEQEEESEEEAERKEINIKTEKNRMKRRETREEEEEQEEESEEEEGEEEQEAEAEEEQEAEGEEEEGEEEEEEGEEEEEMTKKVPKQRAKPNVLPAHRQKNAQRDRQKTGQRDGQKGKGKKQTDDAQEPQFWNSVLPQYLNLK